MFICFVWYFAETQRDVNIFSGRRLSGEVSCSYEKLLFKVRLYQKVTSECFTNSLKVKKIDLSEVKGVRFGYKNQESTKISTFIDRMNVSGFGPLNWIAAKSVTNLIQETVLQV